VAFVTVAMIPAGAGTLTGTATAVNSTCAGVNNGSITATATSGSGPYQYSINNGQTWQAASTFNNLAAGNYNVLIKEGACTSSAIPVTIAPGTLTGTAAATGTACAGVNNGNIIITATSGTGPYQYSINNGQTWQNSNTFNNVAGGNYTTLIREGPCVSNPIPVTVTQGAGLTVSGTSIPASCTGVNNGRINISTTNGTAPFTVSLAGPSTQTLVTATTAIFSNLPAGNYTITVTDASGCSNAASPLPVSVTAGAGFTAVSSVTPVSCFGGNDGTITVTPGAGGNSPYTFVLNGSVSQTGATNTIYTGLTAGTTYSVRVTDAAGCTFTLNSIAITEPSALVIPPPAVQPPLCNGDNNGTIVVNPTGGNAPYTYSINGGSFQVSNTFKVGAGTYAIRVLDAKNCGAVLNNVVVSAPPPLAAIINGTNNATCEGGANGSITVTGTGGTGSYQYSSGGAFQSSNVLNVAAGSYTVTVKDASGCIFSIPDVVVGLTNNLTYTPAPDPAPICEGSGTSLQITSNATGYSWSPGQAGLIDNAAVANPVVHPSTTTLFVVTMTLGVCTAQDAVNVQVLPAPVPNAGPEGEICFGQNYQLQASGGVSYEWTPQRFLSDPFNSSPQVLQPDRTITYSLKVVDANNCASLVSDQITITVIPPIRIKVTPADTVVYAGVQFQLHATSIANNYSWTPATGLSNASIPDPVVTAPLVDGATVQYRVTASTAAGCKGEGSATVRVYKGPEIYVANAFSPNNDGKNDVFIPIPVGIKQLGYFRVFNRWGQLIFSTTSLQQGWDGRLAGVEQPTGVYTWMVEGITQDDRKITKKGTVTLIR
jgi:gliding motility-associated-like protein